LKDNLFSTVSTPEKLVVRYRGKAAPVRVSLFDVNGKRISTVSKVLKTGGVMRISKQGLGNGFYLFKVKAAGKTFSGKFLKVN